MPNGSRTRVVLTIAFALCCACADSTRPDPESTPQERLEASDAALWLSGELLAPDELSDFLLSNYARVRREFASEIPELNRALFTPPWVPGEILVSLTAEAIAQLRKGEYSDLDSLNAHYQLAEVDTSFLNSSAMYLRFEDRLHPERLSEFYSTIKSVLWVEPHGIWGPRYDNLPRILDDGVSFLFWHSWGDCPAGCINSHYWYFKVRTSAEFVGFYDPSQDEEPPWWDEIRQGY